MYYFNYSLIERLPSLLGMGKKQFVEEVGVTYPTFLTWTKGELSCERLVWLCNKFRISIASFLTTDERPNAVEKKTDCIWPKEVWKPVEWHNEVFADLFGSSGSRTGIPKKIAADRLGFSSRQVFDTWSSSPGAARMETLVRMLNEFQLDASLFFSDPNTDIPMPVFDSSPNYVVGMLSERLNGYQELQRQLKEREDENRSIRTDRDRLKRELMLLRQRKADHNTKGTVLGVVSEPSAAYKALPAMERGYVFHHELWVKLHELFDMPRREFCKSVGVPYETLIIKQDVPMNALIMACNLFRVSITHFFVPKSEIPVVHDPAYYRMSPRLFKPIEDCMDRLDLLFGEFSVTGIPVYQMERLKLIGRGGLESGAKKGGTMKATTLCNICTQFNISPNIFFKDENRKVAPYSQSTNEALLLNAIKLTETVRKLQGKVRSLNAKLGKKENDEKE